VTWSSLHLAVVFGLLLFGVLFNWFVAWLGERKRGQVAMLVVIGVAVTLAGAAVVDWRAALWVGVCFVASGAPMVLGEWWRGVVRRSEEAAAARRALEEALRAARATVRPDVMAASVRYFEDEGGGDDDA